MGSNCLIDKKYKNSTNNSQLLLNKVMKADPKKNENKPVNNNVNQVKFFSKKAAQEKQKNCEINSKMMCKKIDPNKIKNEGTTENQNQKHNLKSNENLQTTIGKEILIVDATIDIDNENKQKIEKHITSCFSVSAQPGKKKFKIFENEYFQQEFENSR